MSPRRREPSYNSDEKAQSLVFTLAEYLQKDGDFTAPEPDFLKWMENSLFVDIATSSDEAEDTTLAEPSRKAWQLYHAALEATGEFLGLYNTNLPLFQKITEHRMFLPTLLSCHPDNARFNQDYLEASRLGNKIADGCLPKPQHLARQSWAVKYA